MTTLIPDSWELPSYVAGDVYDMSGWAHRRGPLPDQPAGNEAEVRRFPQGRKAKPKPRPQPSPDHPAGRARSLADIEPYDPEKHGTGPADLQNQESLDQLEAAGFEPHDHGAWFRPVDNTGKGHYIFHVPGHRVSGELRPWHVAPDSETAGIPMKSAKGAIALADGETQRHLGFVFPHWTKVGAKPTRGQSAADRWLAENSDESFEHDPRAEASQWMEENADQYDEWHPSGGDYTYPDFGDAAGQSFHGDETESHVLPGSAYPSIGGGHRRPLTEQFPDDDEEMDGVSDDDDDDDATHGHDDDDYETGDLPQHEQDLADLGFNWQNRGDRNTTPVGIYQEGEYVRHQHDPEGKHIATHRMYRDPDGRSDRKWHLTHEPADTPGHFESHTTHRFPSDAISYYHHNAENALLPSRGYEPHRGRSGVVGHWTRTDTSPTGEQYEHEISNQPPNGEGNDNGWLGQTHGNHMNSVFAGGGTHNQRVQPDLADVVREHDRIGRGLHPGGAQDYRSTRSELLHDPVVSRLGPPLYMSDNFYGDGKVGSAHWNWPHPEGSHLPRVNAEATYNWDKGGYDFKYTHDGVRLAPTHNAVPAGAPVHVPGRQGSLNFPIDHPFNINDYRSRRD